MDQGTLVNWEAENGKRLIEALVATGFEVRAALWVKPTESEEWRLYLASPFYDAHGPQAAHLHVINIVRQLPDLWLDRTPIQVVGMNDTIAETALSVIRSKVLNHPSAGRATKPYPGLIRFDRKSLAGTDIDGAYIYPPVLPTTVA
jgi:hypothetical protein